MKKIILASLILYLPFQLRLPQLPGITLMNIFLILLGIIFIFARNPKSIRAKFETPLIIFLFIWVLSLFHTLFYPGVGMWRYEILTLFKRLFSLVLIYFVFAKCIKTKKELNFLFAIFLISLALVGLHTWRNGMLAGTHFADFKRSSGPFGEGWRGADIAGGFLAIFTPFLLSVSLLAKKKTMKSFGIGGLIICIAGIFTTYSRGSILALGVASIITVLVTIKQLIKTSKLTTLIVMIVLLGLVIRWQMWVPESIIHRAEETTQENQGLYADPEFDESTQARIKTWKEGIEIFKNNPIFGVGFKIPEFMHSYDTHNTFIQIAAEMGIFGLLVFLWLLWKIFRESLLLLNSEFNIIAAGFIGCIIAFIIVNMFYSNFFRDTVVGTFWAMLGILASCKSYITQNAKEKT